MSLESLHQEINGLVDRYFEMAPPDFHPQPGKIPLNMPSYGAAEVKEAIDCLLSSYVTMGRKVAQFEQDFAGYVGAKHAVMVNSGSSANLLALSILANPRFPNPIGPGDEVIVPAVTWSTTLWPIANVGATPVLVDVDYATLNIDPAKIREAITPKTRAVFVVHLLGNPAAMAEIQAICDEHGLILLEDTCESLGATYQGKKVGTFGLMGTYSTYFSHHMTTIEGGLLVTDDDDVAALALTLRSHGWTRHLKNRQEVEARYPDIDPRFLFINLGYNLRPTDVQAAFGLHQLGKLDGFNETRVQSVVTLREMIKPLADVLEFPRETPGAHVPWFGFPMFVREGAPFDVKELKAALEASGIETRPIVAGNLAIQPALEMCKHRIAGDLGASNRIMERGLFVANHGMMLHDEIAHIARALTEFCAKRGATVC